MQGMCIVFAKKSLIRSWLNYIFFMDIMTYSFEDYESRSEDFFLEYSQMITFMPLLVSWNMVIWSCLGSFNTEFYNIMLFRSSLTLIWYGHAASMENKISCDSKQSDSKVQRLTSDAVIEVMIQKCLTSSCK